MRPRTANLPTGIERPGPAGRRADGSRSATAARQSSRRVLVGFPARPRPPLRHPPRRGKTSDPFDLDAQLASGLTLSREHSRDRRLRVTGSRRQFRLSVPVVGHPFLELLQHTPILPDPKNYYKSDTALDTLSEFR